jgi:diguanylate cyclase (GGDEF)-like protein/PAS domain S-box-containing protein
MWNVLLGVGAAIAGVLLVEGLLAAGLRPLAPVAWPSLFVVLTAAYGGFPALGGGALAIAPYFAMNFAAVERFPAFYGSPELPWIWVGAFAVLGLVTAFLRDRAVRASEAPFRAVAENLGALVSYVDATAHFRFNNRLYESWFGLPRGQITGRPMREVLGEASYLRVEPFVLRALAGERVEFEVDLVRDGSVRHIHGVYVPDVHAGGRVAGFYGIISDISRLKAAEQELTLLAHYDTLTGAMNRKLFIERLALAIARGRRSEDPPALLYLDIDNFKAVNDSHGHDVGDALLKEFALRVRRCLRETDAVGRLGGDEFVVLLESVKGDANGAEIAHKILVAVQQPFEASGRRLAATTSIGVALHDGRMSIEAWMKRADDALYEAKNAGRNTIRLARGGFERPLR